jgi:ABC-type Fe3+/spermidine/putrescine transport system ATPase subunit
MFQKAYLFPFMSVGENIAFGLKVKKLPAEEQRKRIAEMLELIGLPGIEKRKPNELSGGEQQRVALARSLVIRPKVLLLDEPFNSLDRPVRLGLQEAVRNIQRELGITTILVTHDLDEAMAMSDRMALLMGGKVAAVDRPNRLFQRPPCVETAKFVGVEIFIEGVASLGTLVSSEWGELEIDDKQQSGRSIFAIRPERIRIQKDKCENALAGIVKNAVYRGSQVEYLIDVGQSRVRVRASVNGSIVERDAQVHVQFPKEYLFVVKG